MALQRIEVEALEKKMDRDDSDFPDNLKQSNKFFKYILAAIASSRFK